MKYSIVIPTYNHCDDLLKPCLESIVQTVVMDDNQTEVIVVANGCTDGTREYVTEMSVSYPNIKLLWFDEPMGYTRATNAGIKASTGEYIVFLNNDVVLLPQEPNYVINRFQTIWDSVPNPGVVGIAWEPVFGKKFVAFYCAMTSKNMIDKIGLLDETFDTGGEDMDFCMKVQNAGYQVLADETVYDASGVKTYGTTYPIYHIGEATINDNITKHNEANPRIHQILNDRYKKKKYAIVIPTYNHCDDLLQPCIESIARNTWLDDKEIQIIVVANGCTDNTKQYLDNLQTIRFGVLRSPEDRNNVWNRPLKVIWSDNPLGYTKATNLGIQESIDFGSDYTILMNNDVTLQNTANKNEWLEMLTKPFNANTGIAGPSKIMDTITDHPFIIFYLAMIRTSLFSEIGLLDEAFNPGYGEDIDFAIRVQRAGYKVIRVPEEGVGHTYTKYFPLVHQAEQTVHDPKSNLKQVFGLSWEEIIKRNENILRQKHGETKGYDFNIKYYGGGERNFFYKDMPIEPAEKSRYEWAQKNIVGNKILEIGCSNGFGVTFLKDVPGLDYLGMDYDADIIQNAKNEYGDLGKFEQQDITTYDFTGKMWDTIICFETLEHLDNGRELAQILKTHCKCLLITTPYREPVGFFGPHHKLHGLTEENFPGFTYKYLGFDAIIRETALNTGYDMCLVMKWVKPDIKDIEVYVVYNEPYKHIAENYAINTFSKEFKVHPIILNDSGGGYGSPGFISFMHSRTQEYVKIIANNMGNAVLLIDGDIVLINPIKEYLTKEIENYDLLVGRNYSSNSITGLIDVCAGFVVVQCNERTLNMYTEILSEITEKGYEDGDQYLLNNYLRTHLDIAYRHLPEEYHYCFGNHIYNFEEITNFNVPETVNVYHANWIVDYNLKLQMLEHFKSKSYNANDVVNIIIATYNRHNELRRALESVEKQTYNPIKVWVCADGPDPVVEQIVNQFNDSPTSKSYKYLALPEHEGLLGSKPRMMGLDAISDTGVVCFLDDDNIIYPNYIERLFNAIRSDGNYKNNEVYIPNSNIISYCRINHSHFNIIPNVEHIPGKFEVGYIDTLNVMINSFVAKQSKSKWQHVDGKLVTHDFDFINECGKFGKSVYIDEILADHCMSENKLPEKIIPDFITQIGLKSDLKSYNKDLYAEIFDANIYNAQREDIENKTIIDIGANVGFFALQSVDLGAKEVYCFEPETTNYKQLVVFTANKSKINNFQLAVLDGSVQSIHITNQGVCSSIWGIESDETAPCISMERVMNNIVKTDKDLVLKMDCEGSEYEIILNTDKKIIQRFETIFIEIHDKFNPNYLGKQNMLRQYITSLGFEEIPQHLSVGTWYPDGSFVAGENNVYKYKRRITPTTTITESKGLVYDCFLFYNELDLLEIRLNELDDVVDKFVLVESDVTFTGIPKPYYYDENKDRFSKFSNKIIHVMVNEIPKMVSPWTMEDYQRNAIYRGLRECNDNDVIIISDVDEIPNPKIIQEYDRSSGICVLEQKFFYYFLNCQSNELWYNSRIGLWKDVRNNTANAVRANSNRPLIKNAGWHFSYLGNVENTIKKIEAFSHQEYNTDAIKNADRLKQKMLNGEDIFDRGMTFTFIDVNSENFPKYITTYQPHYVQCGYIKTVENKKVNHEYLKSLNPVLYNEIFEMNCYRLYSENTIGKVFVDIGANYGLVAIQAVECGAKNVLAFEPNDHNYSTMIGLTKDYPQIETYKKAVFNGSGPIMISNEGISSNIYNKTNENVVVETISIKDIFNSIDKNESVILKIDCEGAEYDILYTAPKEIFATVSTILIEIHNGMNPNYLNGKDDLIKYIVSLGYKSEILPFTMGMWYGPDFVPSENALYKLTKNADTRIRLNLGCGNEILDGYINCDLDNPLADKLFDVVELPYPDNSVDEIRAYHLIEHLPYHKGLRTIKEWFRVLKPNGIIVLETPDFLNMCKKFVESNENDRVGLYPGFFAFPDASLSQAHYFLFTESQLRWTLESTGFNQVRRVTADSIYAKNDPKNINLYLKMIANKPL